MVGVLKHMYENSPHGRREREKRTDEILGSIAKMYRPVDVMIFCENLPIMDGTRNDDDVFLAVAEYYDLFKPFIKSLPLYHLPHGGFNQESYSLDDICTMLNVVQFPEKILASILTLAPKKTVDNLLSNFDTVFGCVSGLFSYSGVYQGVPEDKKVTSKYIEKIKRFQARQFVQDKLSKKNNQYLHNEEKTDADYIREEEERNIAFFNKFVEYDNDSLALIHAGSLEEDEIMRFFFKMDKSYWEKIAQIVTSEHVSNPEAYKRYQEITGDMIHPYDRDVE